MAHLPEELQDEIQGSLNALGLSQPNFAPVTGDASGRRYYRAIQRGKSVVVMIPPTVQRPIGSPKSTTEERTALGYDASVRRNLFRVDAFACLASYLEQYGIRVPKILYADPQLRFAVIEDLGAMDLRYCFERGYSEDGIYDECASILVRLKDIPPPAGPIEAHGLRWTVLEYDLHALHTESDLFLKHYAPYVAGVTASESMWAEWRAVTGALFKSLTRGKLVMRDYHSPNIMIAAAGSGYELALIDFQDALIGPALYDVVSLMEDARREVEPRLKRQMLDRLAAEYSGVPDFYAEYAVIAAQRNLKIIGEFMRYASVGDPRYMQHVPRVKASLDRALSSDGTAELRRWMKQAKLLTPLGL